jgi:hypothetical protein
VKQNGIIHRNEMGELENELDKFPFPEKQLWWDYGCFKDNLEIFTGRGCPSSARSATSTTSARSSKGRATSSASGRSRT